MFASDDLQQRKPLIDEDLRDARRFVAPCPLDHLERLGPAPRPEESVGPFAECEAAVELREPVLLVVGERLGREGGGFAEATALIQRVGEVRIRSAHVVDAPDLERDLEGTAQVGETACHVAHERDVVPEGIERVPLDVPSADRPGDRDRLLADRLRLDPETLDHEDLPEARSHAGAGQRGRVRGNESHGLAARLESGHPIPRDPGVAALPLAEHTGAHRFRDGIDQLQGVDDQRDGTRGRARGCGACRPLEQCDTVEPDAACGVGHPIPELERPLVLRVRVRERVDGLGRLCGADRGLERTREVAGRVPVVGELRGPRRGSRPGAVARESLGEASVEARALAGQELLVDRLPHQGVPEGEPFFVTLGDEDVPLDRFSQPALDLGLFQFGDGREQRSRDAGTGGGTDPQQLLGRLTERGDAAKEDVTQDAGQLLGAGFRGEELLRVEGVSVRARVDPFDEAGFDLASPDGAHLVGRLRPVEARQVEPFGRPATLQLGEERQQWMKAMQLVAAVTGEQHDRRVPEVARQVAEQLEGRPIGPMDVFDDEEADAPACQAMEQAEERLEQTSLRRSPGEAGAFLDAALGGEIGQEPREVRATRAEQRSQLGRRDRRGQAAERLRDRRERDATSAELDAAPDEREGARCSRPGDRLLHETGLADAGLAGHEQHRGHFIASISESGSHAFQLRPPADEHWTRDPRCHARIIGSDVVPGSDRRLRPGSVTAIRHRSPGNPPSGSARRSATRAPLTECWPIAPSPASSVQT